MQVMWPWLWAMLSMTVLVHSQIHHLPARIKRNLVYPKRIAFVQLIAGTGIPVPLESQQAMTVGWVLKAAYNTPDNASYYTNPYVTTQKRSLLSQAPVLSRYDIYASIQTAFKMFGEKDCIMRAICETAQIPFHGSSLVSQILHVIFTPSSTNEYAHPMDRMYEGAARLGQAENTDCRSVFAECKKSITDIFSVLS